MDEQVSIESSENVRASKIEPQRPTSLDLDGSSYSGHGSTNGDELERKHTSSAEEDVSSINTEGDSLDTEDLVRPESRSWRIAESLKSRIRDLSPSRPHSPGSSPKVRQKYGKKSPKDMSRSSKSPSAWLPASFNQMFSNKNKNGDFKRLFKDLPDSEQLIVDYSCALQRDILVHGRLYLSHSWLCFYANIFGWETFVTVRFNDITSITKEKTALVIPNAIQICTQSEKYFFASFISRDTAYTLLFRVWQNALLDQPLSPMELIQMVGKYADSKTDLSSDNYSDDEKDNSERFSNESDSDLFSSRLDDTISCSDSDSAKAMSPTLLCDLKDDVYVYERDQNNTITAPEVSVTPPTPTKLVTEDPLKDAESMLAAKLSGSNEKIERSSPCVSPKTGRSARRTRKAGKGNGSPTQQKRESKESSDDLVEEGMVSDSHGEENTEVAGPLPCFCEQHFCKEMLNEEYPVGVDTLYEYLFTEHEFYKKLQKTRKTQGRMRANVPRDLWLLLQPRFRNNKISLQNLVFEPWKKTENGQRRVVRFTVALNYSIGPKTSPTTEIQYCLKGSIPGRVYVIETEITNEGIPYGDTFNVLNKYCITSVTSKSSRLRITSEVQYKKSVWGFVKSMIEKNSTEGLQGYFGLLGSNLRKETEVGTARRISRRRKSSPSNRRHKRNRSLKENIFVKPPPVTTQPLLDTQSNKKQHDNKWLTFLRLRLDFGSVKVEHTFAIVVSLILVLLLLLNMFLVYRLIFLEHVYQHKYGWPIDYKDLPTDAKEWTKLLQQQSYLHKAERIRFQEILDSSVRLMGQVQTTLTELQSELNRAKFTEFPTLADFPQAPKE